MAQPAPAAAATPAAGAAPRAAAAPALPRPVVLPDEFAGTSGDGWVTYLARFNASCVVNGYTPAQQLQFLPCRLKDAAFQVFTAIIGRIPQITYAQMCAELTAAFNPPQQGPIVEAEFRSRVKKPGETQIEFASALQCLAARAFPGEHQTPLYERLLRNQFVDGQSSSDLRLHIRSASPPDLDTAVRRALEMAAVFNAEARIPYHSEESSLHLSWYSTDLHQKKLHRINNTPDATSFLNSLSQMINGRHGDVLSMLSRATGAAL